MAYYHDPDAEDDIGIPLKGDVKPAPQDDHPATVFFRKARNFLNRPDVKEYAEMGNRALDVAARLGQAHLKGPLATAGAVLGAANVFLGREALDTYEVIRNAVNSEGLVSMPVFYHGLVTALHDIGALEDAAPIDSHAGYTLRVTSFPRAGGKPIRVGFVTHPTNPGITSGYGPYVNEGGASDLLPLFLERFDCDIMTAEAVSGQRGDGESSLRPSAVRGYEDIPYAGKKDPLAFARDFERARARGLSQAYLLAGPPGSGKTTFVFAVAKALKGRALVLDPSVFINTNNKFIRNLLTFVKLFSPAVILLDDVDNITKGGALLGALDMLRRENPGILLMSATNYPHSILPSLRRPGRLGRRIDFLAPDLAEREAIIRTYESRLNIEGRKLERFAKFMEHPLFTGDYIRDVCEKAVHMSDKETFAYIKEIRKYLKGMRNDSFVNVAHDDEEDFGEMSDMEALINDDAPLTLEKVRALARQHKDLPGTIE